jgi:Tfp pilus assembly protein PilZ
MSSSDSANPTHFRAVSRQAVNLLGALRASEAVWNRDVRVIDLGLGGARVEAPDAIEVGTNIELIIETPHLWDPLTLSGAVAWARPLAESDGAGAQIGVRFDHETGGSVRTLTELLEAEAFG